MDYGSPTTTDGEDPYSKVVRNPVRLGVRLRNLDM